MLTQRFGFVGAGKMATALARGFVQAGLTSGDRISAHDPVVATSKEFAEGCGGRVAGSNKAVAEGADVIFIAVKPQQMPTVLSELKEHVAGKLVVSVAAGVTLGSLSQGLGTGARLVRVMPNMPCLIGRGAAAFATGSSATAADAELVTQLIGSVGRAYRLEEKLLDAVTGLSGSGPAFVFVIIEALADGGVKMGLPRDVAMGLAAQTVLGAAAMVLKTGLHPALLKDEVASPGGTTIAGLQALEAGAVRGDIIAAVEAAARRSAELGKGPTERQSSGSSMVGSPSVSGIFA
jgi:pyrroline-5-carboxylate reductase